MSIPLTGRWLKPRTYQFRIQLALKHYATMSPDANFYQQEYLKLVQIVRNVKDLKEFLKDCTIR